MALHCELLIKFLNSKRAIKASKKTARIKWGSPKKIIKTNSGIPIKALITLNNSIPVTNSFHIMITLVLQNDVAVSDKLKLPDINVQA